MAKRIKLEGGHAELSIGGHTFTPDATGAFIVPDEHAQVLIDTHGGSFDPGIEQLEALAEQADDLVEAAKKLVEIRTGNAKAAHARVEAYQKMLDDQAAAKKKEAEDAAKKTTGQQTGSGGTSGNQQNGNQNNGNRNR